VFDEVDGASATNTKTKAMVQVMQTFNPATGPQQVLI
jgi:hypothetical protein